MTKAVYEGIDKSDIYDITPNKQYDVFDETDTSFRMKDDVDTVIFCLWDGCAHLSGGNWTCIED